VRPAAAFARDRLTCARTAASARSVYHLRKDGGERPGRGMLHLLVLVLQRQARQNTDQLPRVAPESVPNACDLSGANCKSVS
jgi:hypothetical protein